MLTFVIAHWFLVSLGAAVSLYLLAGIRLVPDTKVGIVEKRVSRKGSIESGLIALAGEAGFQPAILRGGIHSLLPVFYAVHQMPLVTEPQGKIGYVFARDGAPLPSPQSLASNEKATDFDDVAAFLQRGGQRGPQRSILREGTYALNLAQFGVLTEEGVCVLQLEDSEQKLFERMAAIIRGADDVIGIATVHDGPSLPSGQIIAPTVGDDPKDPASYHNNFQDIGPFLRAGGLRSRQRQVLVEGTNYVNRLFATAEMLPETVADVGNVGVVVSHIGETGTDLSGTDYTHRDRVSEGQKGLWSRAS